MGGFNQAKRALIVRSIIFALLLSNLVLGLLAYRQTLIKDQDKDRSSSTEFFDRINDPGKKRNFPESDPYVKDQVKPTILKSAADNIQVCFKTWIKSDSNFNHGQVNTRWIIQPNGKIKDFEILNSDIPAMNQCIRESIELVKFPSPPEGSDRWIQHKFNFKREL